MVDIAPNSPPRTQHRRSEILLAEDDDELRESLVGLFEHDGYWVTGVPDGDQFLAFIEPIILGEKDYWLPDVIIIDVLMPGIPPIEVVDALRHVGCRVPVVVITGLADPAIREMARELGLYWLQKPLEPQGLEDAVLKALEDRKKESTL